MWPGAIKSKCVAWGHQLKVCGLGPLTKSVGHQTKVWLGAIKKINSKCVAWDHQNKVCGLGHQLNVCGLGPSILKEFDLIYIPVHKKTFGILHLHNVEEVGPHGSYKPKLIKFKAFQRPKFKFFKVLKMSSNPIKRYIILMK